MAAGVTAGDGDTPRLQVTSAENGYQVVDVVKVDPALSDGVLLTSRHSRNTGFWSRARNVFMATVLTPPEVEALREGGEVPSLPPTPSSSTAAAARGGPKLLEAPAAPRDLDHDGSSRTPEGTPRIAAERELADMMREKWKYFLDEELILLRVERQNDMLQEEMSKHGGVHGAGRRKSGSDTPGVSKLPKSPWGAAAAAVAAAGGGGGGHPGSRRPASPGGAAPAALPGLGSTVEIPDLSVMKHARAKARQVRNLSASFDATSAGGFSYAEARERDLLEQHPPPPGRPALPGETSTAAAHPAAGAPAAATGGAPSHRRTGSGLTRPPPSILIPELSGSPLSTPGDATAAAAGGSGGVGASRGGGGGGLATTPKGAGRAGEAGVAGGAGTGAYVEVLSGNSRGAAATAVDHAKGAGPPPQQAHAEPRRRIFSRVHMMAGAVASAAAGKRERHVHAPQTATTAAAPAEGGGQLAAQGAQVGGAAAAAGGEGRHNELLHPPLTLPPQLPPPGASSSVGGDSEAAPLPALTPNAERAAAAPSFSANHVGQTKSLPRKMLSPTRQQGQGQPQVQAPAPAAGGTRHMRHGSLGTVPELLQQQWPRQMLGSSNSDPSPRGSGGGGGANRGVRAAMAAAEAAATGGKRIRRVWERMRRMVPAIPGGAKLGPGGEAQQLPGGSALSMALRNGEVFKEQRGAAWVAIACSDADDDIMSRSRYAHLLKQKSKFENEIKRDVNRTFPDRQLFKDDGGPGQQALYNIIKAYSVLDKDVGYTQGMGFVVATLLMHMGEEDAFCCLVFLMYRCGLRTVYLPDMEQLQLRLYQVSEIVAQNLPILHGHFEELEIKPVMYAADWFLTLFSRTLPAFLAHRVFDVVFAERTTAIVFKLALVLLQVSRRQLLQCPEMEYCMFFLRHELPSQLTGMEPPELVEELVGKALRVDLPFEGLLRLEAEYELLASEAATAANEVQAAAAASEAAVSTWEESRMAMERRLHLSLMAEERAREAQWRAEMRVEALERRVQELLKGAGGGAGGGGSRGTSRAPSPRTPVAEDGEVEEAEQLFPPRAAHSSVAAELQQQQQQQAAGATAAAEISTLSGASSSAAADDLASAAAASGLRSGSGSAAPHKEPPNTDTARDDGGTGGGGGGGGGSPREEEEGDAERLSRGGSASSVYEPQAQPQAQAPLEAASTSQGGAAGGRESHTAPLSLHWARGSRWGAEGSEAPGGQGEREARGGEREGEWERAREGEARRAGGGTSASSSGSGTFGEQHREYQEQQEQQQQQHRRQHQQAYKKWQSYHGRDDAGSSKMLQRLIELRQQKAEICKLLSEVEVEFDLVVGQENQLLSSNGREEGGGGGVGSYGSFRASTRTFSNPNIMKWVNSTKLMPAPSI